METAKKPKRIEVWNRKYTRNSFPTSFWLHLISAGAVGGWVIWTTLTSTVTETKAFPGHMTIGSRVQRKTMPHFLWKDQGTFSFCDFIGATRSWGGIQSIVPFPVLIAESFSSGLTALGPTAWCLVMKSHTSSALCVVSSRKHTDSQAQYGNGMFQSGHKISLTVCLSSLRVYGVLTALVLKLGNS